MKEQPSAILFFLRTSLNKAGFSPATSAFGPWPAAYTEAFRRTRLKNSGTQRIMYRKLSWPSG